MVAALRVYRAVVVSTLDPEGRGRVKLGVTRSVRGVVVPSEGWASVGAAPLGGAVVAIAALTAGDPVLYAAEKLPFVGAVLLCSTGSAPAQGAGSVLTLRLALGQGQEASIEAGAGGLLLRTTAGQQLSLHANGAIEVLSPGEVSVSADQVTMSANVVTVNAGMTRCSGVIKCDTLIAQSVIANSYTPGAGNLV